MSSGEEELVGRRLEEDEAAEEHREPEDRVGERLRRQPGRSRNRDGGDAQ